MTVSDLIEALGKFDPDMKVVCMADEFQTLHDVRYPTQINMVRGTMLFSDDGEQWVVDDGNLCTHDDDVPAKVFERKAAIRVS